MDINLIISDNFSDIISEYHQFAIDKDKCRKCSIYDEYKQVIQSEGNANNPIFMICGESPGQDEINKIKPFIGKAGQRLRRELRKYTKTFNKKTCLISNLLSCRPSNNKFPHKCATYNLNNNKNREEVDADEIVNFCADNWVKKEIAIVKPKILIFLGNQSLKYLANKNGITNHRGSWFFLDSYKAWGFATYHPSYVNRCEQMDAKHYVVEQFNDDIKKISQTWHDYVNLDYRLSLSNEDWSKHQATNFKVKNRLVNPLLQ